MEGLNNFSQPPADLWTALQDLKGYEESEK